MENRRLKLENRKFILTFSIVILIFTFYISMLPLEANAAIISKPPTNLGLVGYWSMNEGTGSYAGDSSGNKNTGTLTNGPTWVDGKRGKALNFDGSNDYVAVSGNSTFDLSRGTIAGWFKFDDMSGGVDFATGGSWLDERFVLHFGYQDNGKIKFTISNGSSYNVLTSNLSPNMEEWYHVAVTYDGTNQKIYVNGSLDNTGASAITPATTNVPLYIGRTLGLAPDNSDGFIDEVRIYNRALSAAEIQALYKSGTVKYATPSDTGLVGYWSMNEGSGSYAGDSSGNKNNGTLTNGPTWVDGKRGKALNFDGGDDFANIPYSFGQPSRLTIAVWFKTTSSGVIFNQHNVAPPGTPSGYIPTLWVLTDKRLRAEIYTIGAVYTTASVADGKWHFATVVADSNVMYLYVDGNFVSSNSGGINQSWWTLSSIGTGFPGGREGSQCTSWCYFSGLIDEVRVYNRALTPSEVEGLYKSGAARFAPPSNTGLVGYWSFDDGAGFSATDFSGKNNTGVFPGGTANPTWVDGKRSKALNFDGGDDYVDVGMVLNLAGDRTISLWLKTANSHPVETHAAVVAKWDGTGYIFWVHAGDVKWGDAESSELVWTGGEAIIEDNQWHFLTATRAGSTGAIYFDGQLKASGGVFTDSATTNRFSIGAYSNGSSGRYGGLIDEVRVYNRALTPSEVEGLYNSR